MEIDKDILYNIVNEFRRKDINKHVKSAFLRQTMKELNLSTRKFAEEFQIPITTLKDWLVFDKITKTEYNNYIKKGLTETEIFRTLRNTKKEQVKHKLNTQTVTEVIEERTELDIDIKQAIVSLTKHLKFPKKTSDTEDLLIELFHLIKKIREKL